jgi:D-alanyl-D-alanine carboxypeptidase
MVAYPILLLSLLAPMQESQADFDRRLDRMFATSAFPGGAVRVAKDGKTVYQRAFGVTDLETKTKAKESAAFEIGSLSKMFTATAALILVQEGKLSLDDKLGAILPDVPESWRGATISQILNHVSGIPDYEEIAGYDFYNLPRQPKEIIDQAAKKEPAFKPGDKFEYSNTGYFLVSMVIEKRAGMPVGKFLKQRIFDPLQMNSTYADVKSPRAEPMTGYHSRTGTRMKQPPIAWTSTLGAGGIVSTLDDMMKWDEALYTDKLVKQDLLSKIWTPATLNDGKVSNYGYGWGTGVFRGMKELNHSGQTNGFTCIVRRYPEQHVTVWAFTNSYAGNVIFPLSRTALIRYFPALGYAALPVPTDPDPARTKQHTDLLKQAVFSQGDFTGMTLGMKDFATSERFAETRKELQGYLNLSPVFRFIRVTNRKTASGVEVQDFLYRQTMSPKDKFWTIGFSGALLSGILVEDE